MSAPLVSIIVPIYNREKTLPFCIEGILASTERDFELLLVDDGSSDGSPGICREYARKDGRVRVFRQENSGVGTARNLGTLILPVICPLAIPFVASQRAYSR